MNDNLQGISFDRVLMRIKDLVQITVAVISLVGTVIVSLVVIGKFMVRVDRIINIMEQEHQTIIRMQLDINELKGTIGCERKK